MVSIQICEHLRGCPCHLAVRYRFFLLLALFGSVAPLHAQGDADIIRGRVIGPDKKPVENVTVTATSLVNQTSRTAKTNKDGRFSIIFNGGGGDYMMAYTGIGFQPTRFEVKREVDEDILVADATIGKTAVVARRRARHRRPRTAGPQRQLSSTSAAVSKRSTPNNVPIDILGDLSAMAATLPGITLIPGADGGASGFSVLGLGADQNNITLNGLNFGSTDLPRDATTQTRVTTSSFDPSRGGFSGAQIALRTNSGTQLSRRARSTRRSTRRRCSTPTPSAARSASVHEPAAQRQRVRARSRSTRPSTRSRGSSAAARARFRICSTPTRSRSSASACRPIPCTRLISTAERARHSAHDVGRFRATSSRRTDRSSRASTSRRRGGAHLQHHGERPLERSGRDEPVDDGGARARRRDAQLRRHAAGEALGVLLGQLPRRDERVAFRTT